MTINKVRFESAAERVERADSFADLVDDGMDPKGIYRVLSRLLHPDAHQGEPTCNRASAAFAKMALLWDEHNGGSPTSYLTITTRKRIYAVTRTPQWKGEIANLYRSVHSGATDEVVSWLKMCRSPMDNEMVAHEAHVLRRLQVDGDEEFRYGAHVVTDSFKHRDTTGKVNRQCVVLDYIPDLRSLVEVHDFYPHGVDPKDVAWIWRRILTIVGWANQVGIVHGAVLPEHVLIDPIKHRLVLVGWGRSVDVGQKIASVPKGRRDWYPAETLAGIPVDPSIDVFMATRCMQYLLGDRAPREFRAFARGCTDVRQKDAWALKEEYDDLLTSLWGRRRYRPLIMPPAA